MSRMKGTTTFETTINCLGDEFDVKVELKLKVNGDDFEIAEINRLDDGSQLIVTSDIMSELSNDVNDHWDEVIGDLEGAYADYLYEQARDERMMEL